jgi:type I restriction enzyme, R subunit
MAVLPEGEQRDFRGHLTDYVRLYAFLAQVLTFADADLEKLYVFARYLREVQQNIEVRLTFDQKVEHAGPPPQATGLATKP